MQWTVTFHAYCAWTFSPRKEPTMPWLSDNGLSDYVVSDKGRQLSTAFQRALGPVPIMTNGQE